MTKREEIREGVEHTITINRPYVAGDIADRVLAYLHSKGCVLKVDRGLPPNCVIEESTGRWFTLIDGMWTHVLEPEISAVEPLIEDTAKLDKK